MEFLSTLVPAAAGFGANYFIEKQVEKRHVRNRENIEEWFNRNAKDIFREMLPEDEAEANVAQLSLDPEIRGKMREYENLKLFVDRMFGSLLHDIDDDERKVKQMLRTFTS